MRLPESCFLLLGGSGGIGKALMPRLLETGAQVIVAGRHPVANAAVGGGRMAQAELDLSRDDLPDQLARLSERFPQITGVIHCAGQNDFGAIESLEPEQLDRMLQVNLRSAILLARHFVPLFRLKGQGSFMLVGSTFGSIGYPGFAAYCATKAGLRGFAEALRRELADTPIQIQYIAPRATRTPMNPEAVNALNHALGNHMDDPDQVAAQILRALESGVARRYLGWPEKLFVVLNSLLPRLVDQSLRKQLPVIRRFLSGGSIG